MINMTSKELIKEAIRKEIEITEEKYDNHIQSQNDRSTLLSTLLAGEIGGLYRALDIIDTV